jgi:hypothetical protein
MRMGWNSAFEEAATERSPKRNSEVDTLTVTSTVRGRQERSTGHSQRSRTAPLAMANLPASVSGVAVVPNPWNVTGAEARAAASAAVAASTRPRR